MTQLRFILVVSARNLRFRPKPSPFDTPDFTLLLGTPPTYLLLELPFSGQSDGNLTVFIEVA